MSIMDLFDKISPSGKIEFVIAGLGNPGLEYENTRHNTGFMTVDSIAEKLGVKIDRMKFKGVYADANINGKRCILLKPTTYMNNSGESVSEILNFYKLDNDRLIVIYDDISLEPGKIRIRRKGTHGGHNGIRSIIDLLGTEDFLRIKMGIGKKPHPDYDLAKWVLGKFKPDDISKLSLAADKAFESVCLMINDNTEEAMNKFNS